MVQLRQYIAGPDPVPDLHPRHDADRMVDRITDFRSTGTENVAGYPEWLGPHPGDITGARCHDGRAVRCRRQAAVILDDARIAPLALDELRKPGQGLS